MGMGASEREKRRSGNSVVSRLLDPDLMKVLPSISRGRNSGGSQGGAEEKRGGEGRRAYIYPRTISEKQGFLRGSGEEATQKTISR